MEEQKIKQDIRIGANIRRIRKNRGIKPMALICTQNSGHIKN